MKQFSGFTLIELLVVVALIMILSSVGVGTFTSATIKSKDTQRKHDLNQMVKAMESFNNDVGRYPLSAPGEDYMHCYIRNGTTVTNPTCDGERLYSIIENQRSIYMDIPSDPEPTQNYVYISDDGSTFELYMAIENTGDADLIKDEDGNVVPDPWGVSCGDVQCNYKMTESGRVKSL